MWKVALGYVVLILVKSIVLMSAVLKVIGVVVGGLLIRFSVSFADCSACGLMS